MKHVSTATPLLVGIAVFVTWVLDPSQISAQTSETELVDLAAQVLEPATPGEAFISTSDPAAPNATEVIIDVQSVFHWSRHQRGSINGWSYALFPDGSGTISQVGGVRGAILNLTCTEGVSCEVSSADETRFVVPAIGAARPDVPSITSAEDLARYLAAWVLAGSGKPPPLLVASEDQSIRNLPVDPIGAALVQTAAVQDTEISEQDELVSDDFTELQYANINDPLASSETPQLEVNVTASDTENVPEPICSEQAQFLPATCAEPTSRLVRTAPPIIRNTDQPTRAPEAVPTEEEPVETFVESLDLSCSVTATTSLGYASERSASGEIGKPRGSFGCSSQLTEKLSLRFSLSGYANADEKKPWDPEFTYAFSYRFSDEITLGYANYGAKFGSGDGGFVDSLLDGSFRASYKLPQITFPNEKTVACSTSLGLPDPSEANFNLSCGYAVTNKLRIGGTANFYLPGTQGDFDPDYSYTASYRISKDWLISYSNYSNNRWPSNEGEAASSGFNAGSVSVTYSFKF